MEIKKILHDTLTVKLDKAFGLDIGDRSIEIVELDKTFRFSVVTYGRTELPAGIVFDGKILNEGALAERLKKLLKEIKPKRVSTNKVIVSLPEAQVLIKCFTVPAKLKSGELDRAILDEVATTLPINVDKTYWDFIEKPLADKNKKLIIFICVPKDIANGYVKFCNSIGLEVVSLCVESLSVARVLLKSSDRQSLIMDIGARTTNLDFFDSNDRINMSITIPVAGDSLTEAVKNKLKLEPAEAEAQKFKLGLKDTKDNVVRQAMAPIWEEILLETKRAIAYYEETFKQKLDDIYLVGGSALLPGLADYIKIDLKREVMVATTGKNINLKSLAVRAKDFPIFANVIGLGMLGASGEFRDMNLLKRMPKSEVNTINRLNLFNLGYLSRVNTVRTVLNNKYILSILIILITIIFVIVLQQAKHYGFASASVPLINFGL